MPVDRTSLLNVDLVSPVATEHPLNRGMVGWWLQLPHLYGGRTLYDLGGRYHGAIQTASVVAAPSSRDGGLGAIQSDGGADSPKITLPDVTSRFAASEGAFSVWARRRDAIPAEPGTGLANLGGSSTLFPWYDGNIYVGVFDSSRPILGVAAPPEMDRWRHYTFVSRAGTNGYRLFVDGKLFAAATRTEFFFPSAAWFCSSPEGVHAFDGWQDDFRLWDRALSDQDVADLYAESRAGYPEALNREPTHRTASATTTITATGSLTVGPIVVFGSASGSISATGSLAVGPVVMSGTAGVTASASGSLSVGPITMSSTVALSAATTREHDVRMDALARLVATNQFDDVYPYSMPEERGQKAGELRAAVVAPVSGVETLEWDDVTAGFPLCRMTFNVTVMARHDDPITRDGTADLLMSVVRNALNGKSLAGLTFVQDTMVVNHAWLPEKPPERQIRCVVQCVYEVPGWNANNTSE